MSSPTQLIEKIGDTFAAGLHARYLSFTNIPVEWSALKAAFASASVPTGILALEIFAAVAMTSVTFYLIKRLMASRLAPADMLSGFWAIISAAVAVLLIGYVASWFSVTAGLPLRTLRLWTVVTAAFCITFSLLRLFLTPPNRDGAGNTRRMVMLSHALSIGIGWAFFGIALVGTLELWQAGHGLDDLARTFLVGFPAYGLFIAAIWRYRRTLASAIAGPRPRNQFRNLVARLWPSIVIALLAVTFACTQIALTMGAPLPGFAVVATQLIIVATPHLDAVMQRWAQRGLENPGSPIIATAARQTARFTILVISIAMLGTLWVIPLALGLGFDLKSVARESVGIALIALIAALLWNVVGTITARALERERAIISDAAVGLPRTRLGTIIPLLSGGCKAVVLAMALLSALVALGFNVWPFITGLSVFGLAVGFGCQALVKDIVSGPFFLVDDAFRYGELIQTADAKGTVERISVRAVSLRTPNGSIVTIPYGLIGTIENFSRDWVVEQIAFRLAPDTDIEMVHELFAQIGTELAADPELGPWFIEPFRGTGISDVADGGLIVTVEFKASPGHQSSIRRAALKAVQSAFLGRAIHYYQTQR